MAPDDRFAEAWGDIPDPIVPSADPPQASRPQVQLSQAASPTRRAMRTRRAIAAVALMAWPALVGLRWGIRPDIAERSSFVVAQAFLFGVLSYSAILTVISAGRRGLGGPVWRARMVAVGLPIVFMVVGLFWLPAGSPGSFGYIGPAAAIWPCLSLGLLVALPVLVVAAWATRGAFPSAAGWRGAGLGVALGLVGAGVLTVHCSSPFGGHVALAHGLPVVIAGLLGGLLGSKVARA